MCAWWLLLLPYFIYVPNVTNSYVVDNNRTIPADRLQNSLDKQHEMKPNEIAKNQKRTKKKSCKQSLTRSIFNWFLKSDSAKVMVAAHVMLLFSNVAHKSFTANEWISSFCENVVTVSHPNFRIKEMRAEFKEESGATVRKNNGNSLRSDNAGDEAPNDT